MTSAAAAWTARRWLILTLMLSGGLLLAVIDRGWFPHDEGALGQSAERVLQGEVPHRDFDEPYTGALTYLHAAAFSVLGIRLTSLRVVLLLATLVWVWALFALGRRILPPPAAALLALLGVAWSVPNYPASMPSWYNLFLATLGTLALVRWIEDRGSRWLILAGFLGGMSFLFKLSGLFFLAGSALFLIEATRNKGVTGTQGTLATRLFMTAVLAVILLMVWRSIAPLHVPRVIVHFVVPIAFVLAGLAWREWTAAASPFRQRFSELLHVAVPFAGGAAIAIAPALIAFAGAGAFEAWREGVFVAPFRRFEYANLPPPRLRGMVALIPLVFVMWPRSDPNARRWRTLAMVLAVLALGALVASAVNDIPHRFVWQSVRGLVPVIGLLVAFVIARPDRIRWPEERRQRVILFGTITVFTALVQFPFGAPTYFLYVAPLVFLASAAIVRADGRVPVRFQGVVAGFYLLFALLLVIPGAPVDLGHRYEGWVRTERLTLPRGGLRLQPYQARLYGSLIPRVRAVAGTRPVWAGPDAPEVYFLGGFLNHTRTMFDFLESAATRETNLLASLEEKGIGVVVVNENPDFTPPLSREFQAEIERRYPNAERIGRFLVRWRS